MRPEELAQRLTSMAVAADVVDALNDPQRQERDAWRLDGWSFDLIPWGVRFLYRERRNNEVTAAVVAVALPFSPGAIFAPAYAHAPWPTMVLLLG